MIGVVDVGGGLRGAYGAGVFDWCLDNNVCFDCCVGVSAGSANSAAYIAKQRGRNLHFYAEYSQRSEYLGFKALLHTRSLLSVEYIYGTLSNSTGEDPLDFSEMSRSTQQFHVIATNVRTGEPVYLTRDNMSADNYAPLKASSSVPLVCRPYPIGSQLFCDGGVSDPIPLQHAFDLGCAKVVVILTRPADFYRDPAKDKLSAKLLGMRYPQAGKALQHRAEVYNSELDFAKKCQADKRALIIAPDSIEGMSTLSTDATAIRNLYGKGYKDAAKITEFLE